jgi:ABC-type uncharacterized transport system permease subunit
MVGRKLFPILAPNNLKKNILIFINGFHDAFTIKALTKNQVKILILLASLSKTDESKFSNRVSIIRV